MVNEPGKLVQKEYKIRHNYEGEENSLRIMQKTENSLY